MTAVPPMIATDRKLLKQQYGKLFDSISATLFDADPIGINFQSNTDEYEPEVGTILPRLKSAGSVDDVEAIVYEEFCRWFSLEDAGTRKRYHPIAARIWELWCEFKKSHA